MTPWLTVQRGEAPLVMSFPHTGTEIPTAIEARLVSPWRARKDADWWIDKLYDFAAELGATTVHTAISRTVIDANRDPSGVSLYPGQATTELCPRVTFDGEPLYKTGSDLDSDEIAERRALYYDRYHTALAEEIARLCRRHSNIVLYDCHSIRSVIPRLFEGELSVFNIGTNSGASCDPALTAAVERKCAETAYSLAVNGRFKGGWITRRYGNPAGGIHAIQMELACRGYMHEQIGPVSEDNWPGDYDNIYAAPMRAVLNRILTTCLDFAHRSGRTRTISA
jgi:formiminoglutamase